MAAFFRLYATVYVLFTAVASAPAFNIVWKSKDGNVHVVDGVFGKQSKILKHEIKTLGSLSWKFTVDGVYDRHMLPPLRVGFATKSQEEAEMLKAPNVLRKLMSKMFNSQKLFVNAVQGRMIERGDFSPVITQCSQNSSEYLAVLILSRKWQKNSYGEITIYDSEGDILRSIHPKYGRVVLIKCGTHFKVSPPCINVEGRHYFLFTEFGHKPDPEMDSESIQYLDLSTFLNVSLKTEENQSVVIDPENFITRRTYSSQRKGIFVYDSAIPSKYVDILHDYIHNHAEYFESPVFEKDSADNVKWIISLDDPTFVNGPIWKVVKQLLIHSAGKEYFPYDLSCNHIRRTDNTHVHKDNYFGADEYTVLIYLNKDWTEDDYGETSFLERNEIIAAVRPRYGRVVIFHGTIDHSAHPAGPTKPGARYTFAIKTAASRELALAKITMEELGLSYEEVMNRLRALEANGTPEQKDLAKTALNTLKSGKLVAGNLFEPLKHHLLKHN